MTTTNTATASVPATKPVIRPGANGTFSVRFPCGGTAEIFPVNDRGTMTYSYSGKQADGTEVNHCGYRVDSVERTLTMAWCAIATAPAALSIPAAEIHALARECEHDTVLFTKTLKRLLTARTGIKFSVRRSTGTASSWVRVGTSECTPAEQAMLSSIFGDRSMHQGHSIRPCGNMRTHVLCAVAGVDMPEGVKLLPPSWD